MGALERMGALEIEEGDQFHFFRKDSILGSPHCIFLETPKELFLKLELSSFK
jgi:hypothetical protein